MGANGVRISPQKEKVHSELVQCQDVRTYNMWVYFVSSAAHRQLTCSRGRLQQYRASLCRIWPASLIIIDPSFEEYTSLRCFCRYDKAEGRALLSWVVCFYLRSPHGGCSSEDSFRCSCFSSSVVPYQKRNASRQCQRQEV